MMSDAVPPSETPPPDGNTTKAGENEPDYDDSFAPPKAACECYCLHCNRVYMSDGIWFQRIINNADGDLKGFWMCPTPNCSGAGFTFDIFPTDPDHPANEGWVEEDGDSEFLDDDEETTEYDPAEPHYAELDDHFADDDDDMEGEEWKLGLEPGERPPEPPWVAESRQRWEEEQKKYSGPDERPRVVDWSDRPRSVPRQPKLPGDSGDGDIDESDIPF